MTENEPAEPKLGDESKFHYDVSIYVELSGKELAELRRLALTHYDLKCKSIAFVDGWLRGELVSAVSFAAMDQAHSEKFSISDGPDPFEAALTRAVEKCTEPHSMLLSWGKLDTVNKILEMHRYLQEPGRTTLWHVSERIHRAMADLRVESLRLKLEALARAHEESQKVGSP